MGRTGTVVQQIHVTHPVGQQGAQPYSYPQQPTVYVQPTGPYTQYPTMQHQTGQQTESTQNPPAYNVSYANAYQPKIPQN